MCCLHYDEWNVDTIQLFCIIVQYSTHFILNYKKEKKKMCVYKIKTKADNKCFDEFIILRWFSLVSCWILILFDAICLG